MKKFSYKYEFFSDRKMENILNNLNELGNEGWEIINYDEKFTDNKFNIKTFLKKEYV